MRLPKLQLGLGMLGDEGGQDKETPHAVHDRRDGGEDLEQKGDDRSKFAADDLGEERRHADPDGRRQEQGEKGGDERAPDERQRAVSLAALGVGIPLAGDEELPAKGFYGWPGARE